MYTKSVAHPYSDKINYIIHDYYQCHFSACIALTPDTLAALMALITTLCDLLF